MMYSVRKNTPGHGNTRLHILICNLIFTALLIWQYGSDYLVIFFSGSLFHLTMEIVLWLTGIRKGVVYLYGRKLPRAADLLLRALAEGPAFTIPAFFVADQFQAGNIWGGIFGSIAVVGGLSFYMGWADRRDLKKLPAGQEPLKSRRAMTSPGVVMTLAVVNTGCLTALFLIPSPFRRHAFVYVIAYALIVMLFYLINYNLGVRMVEIYDPKTGKYTQPGPLMQAAGLAYDSAWEMALLISPVYWIPFYLGLFT